MLDQFFREVGVRDRGVSAVPINVYEEEEALVIEASMPGVRPEDIELSCADEVLTIRGRSSVPDRDYLHQEIYRTEYLRRVPLPAGCSVDGAEASTELGLLRIRVPKPRPRAPERIRIQITRKNSS
jgi:HSP20 family protein